MDEFVEQPSAPSQVTTPVPTPPSGMNPSPAVSGLVWGGLALVLFSVFILVVTNWQYLGPWSKTLLAAGPMVLLFLLSRLFKTPEQRDNNQLLFGSGVLMIGVTAGTALFQFKVMPEINNELILVSSLVGLVGSCLLEFSRRRSELAGTSLIFLTLAAVSGFDRLYEGVTDNRLTIFTFSWAILGLAVILAGFVWRNRSAESAMMRLTFGFVSGFCALWIALVAGTNQLFSVNDSYMFLSGLLLLPGLALLSNWRHVVEADAFTKRWREIGEFCFQAIPIVILASVAIGLQSFDSAYAGFIIAAVGFFTALMAYTWPMITAATLGPAVVALGLMMQLSQGTVGMSVTIAIIGLLVVISTNWLSIHFMRFAGVLALVMGSLSALVEALDSGVAGPILALVLGVILILVGGFAGRYIEWWRHDHGRRPLADYTPTVTATTAHAPVDSSSRSILTLLGVLFLLWILFNFTMMGSSNYYPSSSYTPAPSEPYATEPSPIYDEPCVDPSDPNAVGPICVD